MTARDADSKVRFLLGLLSDEERERLEREALSDDEAYDQLVAAEDELFHDYARGALSDEEGSRFEERFLRSDEGRRRLQRARAAMAAVATGASRPRVTFWWLPAAAALLVALAAGVWWTPGRSPRIAVATPVPPALPNATMTPSPHTFVPPTAILAATLLPGAVRGEGAPVRVQLVPREMSLRLTLTLPKGAAHARYSAELHASDGRTVLRVDGLKGERVPGGRAVLLEIPVSALAEDDYELTLAAGTEPVADYAFGILAP